MSPGPHWQCRWLLCSISIPRCHLHGAKISANGASVKFLSLLVWMLTKSCSSTSRRRREQQNNLMLSKHRMRLLLTAPFCLLPILNLSSDVWSWERLRSEVLQKQRSITKTCKLQQICDKHNCSFWGSRECAGCQCCKLPAHRSVHFDKARRVDPFCFACSCRLISSILTALSPRTNLLNLLKPLIAKRLMQYYKQQLCQALGICLKHHPSNLLQAQRRMILHIYSKTFTVDGLVGEVVVVAWASKFILLTLTLAQLQGIVWIVHIGLLETWSWDFIDPQACFPNNTECVYLQFCTKCNSYAELWEGLPGQSHHVLGGDIQ